MNKPARKGGAKRVDSVQAYLAQYADEVKYDSLSAEAVHAAKVSVIDTLGALIAGLDGEPCRIARTLASSMLQENGATLLGTSVRTTPDMAAFVNATTARFPELTDTYHWPGSAYGHPSDVVMALLSVSEHAESNGQDLITAVVLAYEIFCNFSDVFHNKGFDPSNFACVAIAAGAGKLLGLDRHQLEQCIAMAVTPNVVLRQVRVDHLTMFKVAAAGHAARAGVFAALLAKGGMEGPHLPFEGKAGWSKFVAGKGFKLGTFAGPFTAFKILATRLKIRPSAGNTISSVLAAEKAGPLDDISKVQRVVVEAYKAAKVASGTGKHFWNPQSAETADHSIPYLVAVALKDGTVTTRSYDEAHLWDPAIRRLMKKIEVVENAAFTQAYEQVPQSHHTRVVVTMEDGRLLVGAAGGDEDDLGAPKSDAQVTAKFRGLVEGSLGKDRVDAILDRLWKLEDLQNVAVVPPALVLQ